MQNFAAYLVTLGGLHDSRILKITLDAAKSSITFEVNDLYWNFEGLPEYPGYTPALIILEQVRVISFNLDATYDPLAILEFCVVPGIDQESKANICTAQGKIECLFRKASITSGDRVLWPL